MTEKDGGPAFPVIANDSDRVPYSREPGMSLRDYFAIHAPEPSADAIELQQRLDKSRNPHNDSYKPKIRERDEIIAALRYRFADAMIAERAKP